MFLAMAGAMSSAELGLSLAEMIRQGKIHAISCTGANLEEDIYNLVAHDHYVRIPNYRDLTPEDEHELLSRHLNRVTDTCIPEEEAIRRIEAAIIEEWTDADRKGERYFPHEFLYRMLRSGKLEQYYQIDPEEQLDAGCVREKPAHLRAGLGRLHHGQHLRLPLHERQHQECPHRAHGHRVHDGIGRLVRRRHRRGAHWLLPDRRRHCRRLPHLRRADVAPGYGRRVDPAVGLLLPDQRLDHQLRLLFSGAVPNEKITWEKLDITTPKFIVESDATIVAPLIFAYVLGQ